MVTTISEGFRQFRTNLEITSLQESTTSSRQQNVRDTVAEDFEVLESFLTGSYRRNTMIAPLTTADIDVFIVLDPKYYTDQSQHALLSSITFTDFKVDVVPGFYRTGGGFLIPDSHLKRWIPTDPKKHVDLWSASNKAHHGSLVPLIKMLKCWNREKGNLFRSFHLEVLVRHVLKDVTITDYPSGARWGFDKMRDKVWTKIADPAGYSDDVASYLAKSEADRMIAALDQAYRRARTAENYSNQGYAKLAIDEWRSIFADYFPAYG